MTVADMNLDLKDRTIILGVTGSIAAYKAADITSRLTEAGAKVFPVMTVRSLPIYTAAYFAGALA